MSFPFEQSVAETLFRVQQEMVLPSEIMCMPGGPQFYNSERGREFMNVNADVAKIMNEPVPN
jgi:hypothetical protein